MPARWHFSSTTLYSSKYAVLQSTTVYYSSTTLYDKVTLSIDPWHKWNVIYNARSNSTHPPTSPNTAPATQHDTHDGFPSHMKRHLQCAQLQESPSNCAKYWACRAKWLSWLTVLTYETSFRMCGATGITLQPHQILHLPRKIALQNLREICHKRLKRHLQWRMIRAWFDHDPSMTRERSRHLAPARWRGTFRGLETHFLLKIKTFRAPAIYPDFTKCCACREKWHCNITKCCTCHESWLRVTWLSRYLTELLFYWLVTELLLDAAVTWLTCYWAELFPSWAVTELNCYFAELLLYWAVTLLNCYFTELLLYWTFSLLNRYFTELLLYWAVTLLNF